MKRHFTNSLGTCQTFVTAPRPMTGCDSPWRYMAMRALIEVEEACELIFYSMCNFMCFYPKLRTATLYCLTCMCVWSVYSVYFILNFILYTNIANEFIISFEITYQILQLYIKTFSFLLYGLMMAINVAQTCGCWHCCIECCVDS